MCLGTVLQKRCACGVVVSTHTTWSECGEFKLWDRDHHSKCPHAGYTYESEQTDERCKYCRIPEHLVDPFVVLTREDLGRHNRVSILARMGLSDITSSESEEEEPKKASKKAKGQAEKEEKEKKEEKPAQEAEAVVVGGEKEKEKATSGGEGEEMGVVGTEKEDEKAFENEEATEPESESKEGACGGAIGGDEHNEGEEGGKVDNGESTAQNPQHNPPSPNPFTKEAIRERWMRAAQVGPLDYHEIIPSPGDQGALRRSPARRPSQEGVAHRRKPSRAMTIQPNGLAPLGLAALHPKKPAAGEEKDE